MKTPSFSKTDLGITAFFEEDFDIPDDFALSLSSGSAGSVGLSFTTRFRNDDEDDDEEVEVASFDVI